MAFSVYMNQASSLHKAFCFQLVLEPAKCPASRRTALSRGPGRIPCIAAVSYDINLRKWRRLRPLCG